MIIAGRKYRRRCGTREPRVSAACPREVLRDGDEARIGSGLPTGLASVQTAGHRVPENDAVLSGRCRWHGFAPGRVGRTPSAPERRTERGLLAEESAVNMPSLSAKRGRSSTPTPGRPQCHRPCGRNPGASDIAFFGRVRSAPSLLARVRTARRDVRGVPRPIVASSTPTIERCRRDGCEARPRRKDSSMPSAIPASRSGRGWNTLPAAAPSASGCPSPAQMPGDASGFVVPGRRHSETECPGALRIGVPARDDEESRPARRREKGINPARPKNPQIR